MAVGIWAAQEGLQWAKEPTRSFTVSGQVRETMASSPDELGISFNER